MDKDSNLQMNCPNMVIFLLLRFIVRLIQRIVLIYRVVSQ